MADNSVKVIITADVEDFRLKIGLAKKSAGQLSREVNKLDKETVKQTSDMEKQAAGARAVGGRFGELAERFTNAHKALGTFGVVALGSVTAMTAMVGITAAVVAGSVALVKTSITLARELEGVIDVTDEEREALERADRAFEGLDAAMATVTVTAGADLAPAMSEVSEVLAQVVLATEDAADALGLDLNDALFVLSGVAGPQAKAMLDILDAITVQYKDDVRDLSAALREQMDATKLTDEAARRLAIAERDLAVVGLEGEAAIDAQIEAAKRLVRVERAGVRDRMDAAEEGSDAHEAAALTIIAIETELEAKIAELEEKRTALLEKEAEARRKIHETEAEARVALNEAQTQAELDAAQERLDVLDQIAEARRSTNEEAEAALDKEKESIRALLNLGNEQLMQTLELGKADALTTEERIERAANLAEQLGAIVFSQFENEKQAAIAGILLSTAVGIARAIAQSPPPSPFGLIGAGIVAASGATQLAAVEKASPPSKHLGGLVGPDSDTLPPSGVAGDVAITAQVGETVRTAAQERELRMMQPIVIVQADSRLFEAQARMSLDRGALRDAVSPDESIGQERFVKT